MDSCRRAAALAVVSNNPTMSLFNICLFIKPQLCQRILCTSARFEALGCEWGGWTGKPLSPRGWLEIFPWKPSISRLFHRHRCFMLLWMWRVAVAEQVSCKAPLKRGESRERSEGMAAVFQARHAQAATQVHFSSGYTWPLLESKISLTTQGLKTVIMWTKKKTQFC